MGEVLLERQGPLAVLTISNPSAKNSLTDGMCRQLSEHCDRLDRDTGVGAVVVRGADGTFCSGADTRGWDPSLPQAGDEVYDRTTAIYDTFVRVGRLLSPTIAAVRGAAVGAGLNLAMATDLRIMSESARLIGGFMRIGLHPGGGFFTLAARTGGRELAAAAGLFGEELSGRRAAELGMAWEALDDGRVEGRALELAARVARDPVLARRATATFRSELGPPAISWQAAIEVERGVQMWSQHRRLAAAES